MTTIRPAVRARVAALVLVAAAASPTLADRGEHARTEAEQLFNAADEQAALRTEAGLRQALVLYERALPLWVEAGDVANEALTYNQMGILRRRLGDPALALELYGRALELYRRAGDREGEADVLNNRGRAYVELDEVGLAREHYEAALALWRQLDDPRQASTLRNLGQLLKGQGEPTEAIERFRQALEISRHLGDAFGQGSSLNSLGECQAGLGEIEAAERSFREALELARAAERIDLRAAVLSNLGHVLRQQGDLGSALEHFLEALDLFRQLGQPVHVAEVLENLGTIYVDLGQLRRALEMYREAGELFRGAGRQSAAALVALSESWVRMIRGEIPEAVEELERLLAERRAAGDGILEGEVLHALGFAHLAAGRPRQARDALEKALERWRAAGEAVRAAAVTAQLGKAYAALGDAERAAANFEAVLESGLSVGAAATSYAGLARLERDRGRLEAARELAAKAVALTETRRGLVPTPELRATFLGERRSYYELYLDLLIRLHHRHPDGGFDVAAFEASERARARGLLDLLAERGDGGSETHHTGADETVAALAGRERAVAARLTEVQTKLAALEPQAVERRAALERQLSAAEEALHRLEIEIRREHPRYGELRYGEPVRLEEVQRLLAPGTALVEYVLGDDGVLLFVVTREAVESFRLDTTASRVAELVGELRAALTPGGGRRRLAGYRSAAWSLYRTLVEPAAASLERVDRLLVVPDGSLHYLPFEALLTQPPEAGPSADGTWPYLLKRWTVSYAPSASVLASLTRAEPGRPATGPAFLAFADPTYGDGPGDLPRLAASAREVAGIAGLYPPSSVVLYQGSEARETNVEDNELVRRARRLHFAVHGLLDDERPQLSALALARGGDGAEDGLLQVHEIARLDLAAEFVVLSACDTALGHQVRGEGLLGLARAFLYAGAPRVVVSLWRVDDEAAAELMVRFYRALEGRDTAAALHAAKLEMVSEGRFAHPVHWAAFVLIGRP